MRIPLATNLKTRTGAPSTKDARQVNSYMEVKGDQAAVRKRPAAQGGIAVGTGTAQGGIGFSIGGTPYFIGFWGDTMQTYTGSGTSWSSGTFYLQGDHVSINFVDYWALVDNQGNNPTSSPTYWTRNFFPPKLRYSLSPSAANISVSLSRSTVGVGLQSITTGTYLTYKAGTGILLDSGSGTLINTSSSGPPFPGSAPAVNWSNYMLTSSEMATYKTNYPPTGVPVSYPLGYDYYLVNGNVSYTWNGAAWVVSGGSIIGTPY